MVHASRGRLPPASEHLRSEPAIIAGMARATLPHSKVPWQELIADYDRIRDGIEAVFPEFANFNERIRVPGGFRFRARLSRMRSTVVAPPPSLPVSSSKCRVRCRSSCMVT
jgi:hypothetical protein